MRTLGWIISPWIATLLFWSLFAACIDTPSEPDPPPARLVASWDPLACGEPHRVVLDLEDEAGVRITSSTPCWLGGLALDVEMGLYRGRIYAWVLDQPIRSVSAVSIAVDATIVRWQVPTPP